MNYTLTPAMKSRFKDYLAAAAQSGRDLQFVLENLGVQWHADYSLESLELAEVVFWKMVSGELKDPVVSTAHFADLIARYLGEIVARAGRGKWAQSEEPNHTFGQPVIDLSEETASVRRLYPADLANNILHLNRSYPGAATCTPFSSTLKLSLTESKRAASKYPG